MQRHRQQLLLHQSLTSLPRLLEEALQETDLVLELKGH